MSSSYRWEKIILGFSIFLVVASIAMYFGWLGGPRALNLEHALFVWNGVTLLMVSLTYWKLTARAASSMAAYDPDPIERERTFDTESGLIRPGLRSPAPPIPREEERRTYNEDAP